MTSTDPRQPVDLPIPLGDGPAMGLAGDSEPSAGSSWQAIAAVYASVPLAVVGFLWLYSEHHVGDTPLWLMIVLLAVTSVVNFASVVWLRRHPGPGAPMQARLAVSAFSTAAIVYAIGWGSMFAIGFAVGVAEIVRSNGTATWRGALGWNAAAVAGGEIAIQLHLAPSILPLAIAHEVALLGFCCLAVVTRVLVLTGRSAEVAESKLRERSEHFESLVAHASDVIGVVDSTGTIRFVSPAVGTLLGYQPAELTSTQLADLIRADDVESIRQLLDDLAQHPGSMDRREDVRFRHRNGSTRLVVMSFTSRDASGAGTIVINLHDVTVERALEERLRFDAMHDPLTGTWNRAAFTEAMEMACAASARDGGTIAMLFVDIDGFKQINDTLGHDRGDELLTHVARSIQNCLRGADLLGRWGGDEFVVLLNRMQDPNEAIVVADRILAELDGSSMSPDVGRTTVSIGIATATDGVHSAATMARLADEAMYAAKRGGRARWAVSPLASAI
jgi:diguanylate cyclase (GGDEF)-like protein/PAS domain S-box-containing protein